MENMLTDVFGFYATERVQTDLVDDDAHYIATWMTSNNQIHQIAVRATVKAHHVAFKLQDWAEVGHAGDLFADGRRADRHRPHPSRHHPRADDLLLRPVGQPQRGLRRRLPGYPDRPTVKWTPDQIAKGIFYHAREINERFTTVST